MKTIKYILSIVLILSIAKVNAQDILTGTEKISLSKAVEIAMLNNYELKIASNELKKADNNNTVGNAGLLPSLTLNGGVDYGHNDTEMEFTGQNSEIIKIDNAESLTYNSNVRMDYTLFDGFGNVYTYKKLQGANERQETLFRQQTELTIVQVAERYYEVCRAQQNLHLAKESMRISRERLQKAMDKKAYGQANQLDVLNAEVDMNSDSTIVLQTEQAFLNSVKDLNVVLGVPVQNVYQVVDAIKFRDDFTADKVISGALLNNAGMIAQKQQEGISNLDLKITKAQKYPTISAYGQYGYNRQDNDAGQIAYNQSMGSSAGVSLKFNIFNGQQQRTKEKNATLDFRSQQERSFQLQSELERDAANAYTDYVYKRRIVELQETSVEQAQLNFEQTQEMYQLGRVTAIEFRTAQQNLLDVAANFNNARFTAKVAEFYLLQLTGELIN
ncbi:TolC family protein [Carboxylicivirga sp. N1Y90]|uniref:TolC family protein n=1 Tax=Carboxylicivirga fragile TaxID=3417571 RepID=UPI003D3295BD|nr:TolC family protein [Marinilabiliaceae bacterium N1Y90]